MKHIYEDDDEIQEKQEVLLMQILGKFYEQNKDGAEWARDGNYEESMKKGLDELVPIIDSLVDAEEEKSKLDA